MGNKALKVVYTIFIGMIFIALAIFLVQDIRMGISTNHDKIMLAMNILLMIWAAYRFYILIRNLRS